MALRRTIRIYCKRCDKWYVEEVDLENIRPTQMGLFSVAFDHGNHILTVFFDKDFNVRGENLADKAGSFEDPRKRALDYFDRY